MIIIIWHYVQMPSALLVLWEWTTSVTGVFTSRKPVMMFSLLSGQTNSWSNNVLDVMTLQWQTVIMRFISIALRIWRADTKSKKSILSQIIRKYYLRMCCICFVEETHWKPLLSTRPTATTVISLAFDSPLSSVTKIRLLTHSYICTHTHIYIELGHHWIR